MSKNNFELIAAIDVGSNYIRMSIAQAGSDGRIEIIEDLTKPTDIGRDCFSKGRVSVKTMHQTCDTLKGFVKLIKDYRIKKYRAVSTTGIREAENQEFILEHIRLSTGLEIEVINQAQERFLMYKGLKHQLQEDPILVSKCTLIINITSGGIEVSIYENGNLMMTEYIKLGSLRLKELLSGLESKTSDFPGIMEEFIESKIYLLKSMFKNMKIDYFLGLGGELSTIYTLSCGDISSEKIYIKKERLEKLYSELKHMSSDQIIEKYDISRKQEEILLPSVILFNSFLRLTRAQGIHAPMISLRHGILYDMADEIFSTQGSSSSKNDIISSTWYLAEKYGVVKKHAAFVEKMSLSIFDQTWKLHKLGERERLYLNVAAILHDIGNYINISNHDINSYNIISTQNIMGFSDSELNLIANIARYHSKDIPDHSHPNYNFLDNMGKIIVSKLSSILKLAEAIDISHTQKIDNIEINFSGDTLNFILHTKKDILLERWDLQNNLEFFEEIMGIETTIKSKG